MPFGTLYERAVELSPQAARIAARLLAQDPVLPFTLRRALAMALGRTDATLDPESSMGNERAFRAARSFVNACHETCLHLNEKTLAPERPTAAPTLLTALPGEVHAIAAKVAEGPRTRSDADAARQICRSRRP